MDNYELTDVAKEMGFTSLDDKVQLDIFDEYCGYGIEIKRLCFALEDERFNGTGQGTFRDLITAHEKIKEMTKDTELDETYLSLTPVWYTGYIALPKGTKFYEKDVDELDDITQFHGGITFDGYLDKKEFKREWIQPPRIIGFDCNHFDDVVNAFMHGYQIQDEPWDAQHNIWNIDRVKNELTDAIDRLIEYGDAKDEL